MSKCKNITRVVPLNKPEFLTLSYIVSLNDGANAYVTTKDDALKDLYEFLDDKTINMLKRIKKNCYVIFNCVNK